MLDDGRELGYDRPLLATGAEPRPLPLPGADPEGIYYLGTLAACYALRGRLEGAARRWGSVPARWERSSPLRRASAVPT
jgi:NADPH-dependent 2,4-dienoyl-CoA reductase/sulfur reductase-like enzyme